MVAADGWNQQVGSGCLPD